LLDASGAKARLWNQNFIAGPKRCATQNPLHLTCCTPDLLHPKNPGAQIEDLFKSSRSSGAAGRGIWRGRAYGVLSLHASSGWHFI